MPVDLAQRTDLVLIVTLWATGIGTAAIRARDRCRAGHLVETAARA